MALLVEPLTIKEYRLLPESGPRYQLIEGELFMAPAPNRYHQSISRNLEYILMRYLEIHSVGELYHAPFDIFIDETNVFQPDIVFVSNSRLAILTEEGIQGAPDFIVEILSPKTAIIDRTIKPSIYARSGVQELWLIDPNQLTIEVFHLQKHASRPEATYGATDRFSSETFPGVEFDAAKIFQR